MDHLECSSPQSPKAIDPQCARSSEPQRGPSTLQSVLLYKAAACMMEVITGHDCSYRGKPFFGLNFKALKTKNKSVMTAPIFQLLRVLFLTSHFCKNPYRNLHVSTELLPLSNLHQVTQWMHCYEFFRHLYIRHVF